MTEIYTILKQALKEEQLVALATILGGAGIGRKLLIWPDGQRVGSLGLTELDEQVQAYALTLMATQQSQRKTFEGEFETFDVFIDIYPPPPKLIIIGAVHIARPLVTFGNELGFQTIVIDARATFATPQRFPHADKLLVRWPADALQEMKLNEACYIVFLSHDEKLDNPALAVVLKSAAHYIGALGAKKTHARRVNALKEMGISDEQINRIHAPVGLALGGQRPEEIAVSIIAEIVAVRQGR